MKNKLLLILCLALAVPLVPVAFTGCAAPSTRVIEVQSLKSVGQSAEATVALSAQLYRDGKITPAQARQVMDFYNLRFQPAFRFAVTAVQANLESIASPAVVDLASQLAALVLSFQTSK
jgi:hypothetical protein